MSLLLIISAKLYEESILLFESFQQTKQKPDYALIKVAMKSAVYCRPWSYVMWLLNESKAFGFNDVDLNDIITACTTSLRKVPAHHMTNINWRQLQMEEILEWMKKNQIAPTGKVLVSWKLLS